MLYAWGLGSFSTIYFDLDLPPTLHLSISFCWAPLSAQHRSYERPRMCSRHFYAVQPPRREPAPLSTSIVRFHELVGISGNAKKATKLAMALNGEPMPLVRKNGGLQGGWGVKIEKIVKK